MVGRWGGRTWLRLTKEAEWGAYDADANPADVIWVRLDQDNAFQMKPTPRRYTIRSADARNEIVESGSAQFEMTGTLNTLLYPEQADFLLGWGTGVYSIGDAEAGEPLDYDLKSVTADYYDGVRFRRFLGVKVAQFGLASSNENPPVRLNLSLQGWKPDGADPALPEPAYTAFPQERCFIHQDSKGLCKFGSAVARTRYREINLNVQNILDVPYDEDYYPSDILYCGRDINYSFVSLYKRGETDRANYEQQVYWANNIIAFTRPGASAKTLTLDVKSRAKIDNFEVNQPLNAASYATINVVGQFDGAANTGFSYSVA